MANETDRLNALRIAGATRGWRLFRNNSGVLFDRSGRPVRYGLANESKAMNAMYKSGDLIGFTADGRFISIEDKPIGGDIEPAQVRWRDLVLSCGGIALIAYGPEDLP